MRMRWVVFLYLLFPAAAAAVGFVDKQFGPFNQSYYNFFNVLAPAVISNDALQLTPDSAGNFSLANRAGRIFFNQSFKLWDSNKVASFDTSFLFSVFRPLNASFSQGEGLAFVIAPNSVDIPRGSGGQYLGLTNATTDGDPFNKIVAVELDTYKESFDPDDNHLGLDINSVKSVKTVSLSDFGIEITTNGTRFHTVWIQYDGVSKRISVFMAEQKQEEDGDFVIQPRPTQPIMTADLDLAQFVNQNSYLGFAASTGNSIQLNSVLRWSLTVELLPGEDGQVVGGGGGSNRGREIGLGVGVLGVVILVVGLVGLFYYVCRRRRAAEDPAILGALKRLPGMPREFKYNELKKATNNFDEKNKLGQGGFGVVYRGLLPQENVEIAVKRFSRDNLKGKDDFLAELTIINRLRHKHLVRLLGWCHKKGTLLLVYDYMPNGSLDNHLFCSPEKAALSWSLRYKITSGVAAALHYLHNEYDQKVVHRDLKASNIMLDANFDARLGDFGLARAIDNERTSYADQHLDGVPGTIGYIAPECFHTGKATRHSDVYGFGAVLLELVCGQRPWTKRDDFNSLVDWVWWLHREGCLLEAVDQRLGNDYSAVEAERLLLLGLACSHPNAEERPNTQSIVQIISGSMKVPHVPPFKPTFMWPLSMPEGAALGLDNSDNINYVNNTTTSNSNGLTLPR